MLNEYHQTVQEFYKTIGFRKEINWVQTHKVLLNLALTHQPKVYGEIGSHIGCSMSYVALACPNAKLFSFDSPNSGWGGEQGTEGFLKQAMNHFAHGRAELTFGKSQSKPIKRAIQEKGPYDLFMIDGDHSPEGCREDFLTVLPNMSEGGILVIDDLVHHPKLGKLFNELVREYNFKSETFVEQDESVRRGVGVIYL